MGDDISLLDPLLVIGGDGIPWYSAWMLDVYTVFTLLTLVSVFLVGSCCCCALGSCADLFDALQVNMFCTRGVAKREREREKWVL